MTIDEIKKEIEKKSTYFSISELLKTKNFKSTLFDFEPILLNG